MDRTKNLAVGKSTARVLKDILCGAGIGVAFIIPGFSGGTVAAILGIYERLVEAITGLFRAFRKSVATLLPIAFGMVLGAALFILPIRAGMDVLPLPTVSLFVGLALGGIPPLRAQAGRPTKRRWAVFAAALLVSAALVFLPTATRPAGFLYELNAGGYVLLFLVGVLASCALVVPGISGSMLLLIFGYYTPLVTLITDLLLTGREAARAVSVLLVMGAGIAGGFFLITAIMRVLLKRYRSGTHYAILGFILGSVPAAFAPALRLETAFAGNIWYYLLAVLFFLVGLAASTAFLRLASKKSARL